jgi:hypothetical protein
MADGYGFGGEGDWKTSTMLATVKAMGRDRLGGTSFMEDYTYHLVPGEEKILGSHMLEVCPTISTASASCEIHPLGIGDRADPVRLVFTADPGTAVILGITDVGDRFRLVANVGCGGTGRAFAETARGPGGLGTQTRLHHRDDGVAHRRRPAPHGAVHRCRAGRDRRPCGDVAHGTAAHRGGHPTPRLAA